MAHLLAVGDYWWGWANLLVRWLHVIAAIAWIGASFYFVLLDQSLREPKDVEDRRQGVGGELWEVHGGGFYHVKKYKVAPPVLPEHLAWFKWEAYTTWLSGFGLMVVLYYFNANAYLIDPSVADLSSWEAVAISIGLLIAAWVVYDVLCRVLVRHGAVLWALLLVLTTLAAWGCAQLFQPRAAFLQVGAMLGTIMAGNVLFNIIPAHRELVRAKEAGRDPDPQPGIEAKRRSVHNNYLTLPVLLAMLSAHFAFLYGHSYAWLLLVGLMAIGAWVRHYFNLRHRGRTVWIIPVTAALALAGIAVAIRPSNGGSARPGAAAVPFAEVEQIVAARCAPCHSQSPTYQGFTAPPLGIAFDTPEEIKARAQDIRAQAVDSQTMPLGNVTHMTPAERERLGLWIEQGARIP
jgi:uncharacterized membrane protein